MRYFSISIYSEHLLFLIGANYTIKKADEIRQPFLVVPELDFIELIRW